MMKKLCLSLEILAAMQLAMVLVLPVSLRADDASAALYKSKCAACHGADGKGDTTTGKAMKLRDLGSAEVQKASDADWSTIITAGKNKMPPVGKSLSADQVKGLVGYVRSFAKK
ncbi:MAG TPA: cytochrome c [Candidatus Acidoferrum sp.]|nr:cytochrome c [Candidatus Acidoferrum sp.]